MGKIYLFSRRTGLNTLNDYEKELSLLKDKEASMKNPLLKEWFEIRNKIRYLERKVRDFKNGKIN